MTSLRPRDAALLAAVAAMWGFNFVPIHWALDSIPPFALGAIRFTLAAIPAILFVRRPRAPAAWVVAYGLAIGVGQFGLLFLALRLGVQAGLASLLMQVQVFLTIAIAALALGDRMSRAQIAGACVAAIGVAALVAERIAGGASSSIVGLAIIGAAALSWAMGNVIAKAAARKHGIDMFSLVVWSSLVAPLPLAAMSLATEPGAVRAVMQAPLLAWASTLFMAYAATLWGFGVWNKMLHRYPAGAVTPFALLVPVAGFASTALLLHERITALEMAASGVILCGLAIAVIRWRPRNSVDPAPPAASRVDHRTQGPQDHSE